MTAWIRFRDLGTTHRRAQRDATPVDASCGEKQGLRSTSCIFSPSVRVAARHGLIIDLGRQAHRGEETSGIRPMRTYRATRSGPLSDASFEGNLSNYADGINYSARLIAPCCKRLEGTVCPPAVKAQIRMSDPSDLKIRIFAEVRMLAGNEIDLFLPALPL